jgi:hypothetical protein
MFAVLASGAISGCAMLSSGDPDISGTGLLVGGAGLLLFGIAVNASKSSTGIIFFGPQAVAGRYGLGSPSDALGVVERLDERLDNATRPFFAENALQL